jgi:hypothetical protein
MKKLRYPIKRIDFEKRAQFFSRLRRKLNMKIALIVGLKKRYDEARIYSFEKQG